MGWGKGWAAVEGVVQGERDDEKACCHGVASRASKGNGERHGGRGNDRDELLSIMIAQHQQWMYLGPVCVQGAWANMGCLGQAPHPMVCPRTRCLQQILVS